MYFFKPSTFLHIKVYGPFGLSDPNSLNSPIKRMKPSYRLRNITMRDTKPDGTILTTANYGPVVSARLNTFLNVKCCFGELKNIF